MTSRHFRLVFKRSQSPGPKPTFSLLVAAEMTPDFIDTAKHYGLWNDIVYADPQLQEARELRARQAELKAKQRSQRTKAALKSVNASTVSFVLPAFLTYKIMKLIYIGPFKLIWWLYCAFRTQKTQIMRLHELATGKVITANTLTEIAGAEQLIQETTETIETYIHDAAAYGGEAFEPRPTV